MRCEGEGPDSEVSQVHYVCMKCIFTFVVMIQYIRYYECTLIRTCPH
ncbi:hypothetical protein TcasGA2_TC031471 [Tribolium castaneum]|uniref:Uncharacterized protein n=1 Tax=Tribolium castaneum TaxID=7070 RepID=A0A139WLU1_TRICA|nr:hypothetical protein TcasGA2_TC031471 [Tribolium castaneum]